MFVQFTIPRGTVELGQLIDACVARCVERWGGCTVTNGIGYWKNPDHDKLTFGLVETEPVAILGVECSGECHGRRPQAIVREWFDNLAVYVRVKGDQHTVYYRMFDGGEARFVGPGTVTPPHESRWEKRGFIPK
jgi:hypothetical protein